MNDFIVKYYLVIMLVTAFILFALIGYLAENLKKKQAAEKENKNENLEASVETVIDAPEVVEEIIEDKKAPETPAVEETQILENTAAPEALAEEIPVSTDTPEIVIPEVENDEDNNK